MNSLTRLHLKIAVCCIAFSVSGFSQSCREVPKCFFNDAFVAPLRALNDTSVEVKEKAARQIKVLAGQSEANSCLFDTLIEYALQNLLVNPPPHWKSLGEKWLSEFRGYDMPAICRRFKNEKDRFFRRALVASLAGKKDPVSREILKLAFDDPDSSIVVESIRIYGESLYDDSYYLLTAMLTSESVLKRVGAIRGLKYFQKRDAARKIFEKILRSRDVFLGCDFELEPGPKMNPMAVYVVDTLSDPRFNSLHKEASRTIAEIAGKEVGTDTAKLKGWLGPKPNLDSLVVDALNRYEDKCPATMKCGPHGGLGELSMESLGCDVFPILERIYKKESSPLKRQTMIDVVQSSLRDKCPCACAGLLRVAMDDTTIQASVRASQIYAYRQCSDAREILQQRLKSPYLVQRLSAIYGVKFLMSWESVPILLEGLSIPDESLGSFGEEVSKPYASWYDHKTTGGKAWAEKYLTTVHGFTKQTINEIIFAISKESVDGDTTLIKAWIKKQQDSARTDRQ